MTFMVDRPSEKTDSILIKQNRGSDGSPAAVLFYAAVLAVGTQKKPPVQAAEPKFRIAVFTLPEGQSEESFISNS